jgi:hypothetical protein
MVSEGNSGIKICASSNETARSRELSTTSSLSNGVCGASRTHSVAGLPMATSQGEQSRPRRHIAADLRTPVNSSGQYGSLKLETRDIQSVIESIAGKFSGLKLSSSECQGGFERCNPETEWHGAKNHFTIVSQIVTSEEDGRIQEKTSEIHRAKIRSHSFSDFKGSSYSIRDWLTAVRPGPSTGQSETILTRAQQTSVGGYHKSVFRKDSTESTRRSSKGKS